MIRCGNRTDEELNIQQIDRPCGQVVLEQLIIKRVGHQQEIIRDVTCRKIHTAVNISV